MSLFWRLIVFQLNPKVHLLVPAARVKHVERKYLMLGVEDAHASSTAPARSEMMQALTAMLPQRPVACISVVEAYPLDLQLEIKERRSKVH
jgi:hypothetical protein